MQLAHAGRKASTLPPWEGRAPLTPDTGGWQTIAPPAIPFNPEHPAPKEMDKADLEVVARAFGDATGRAHAAGFRIIEVHAAHGYLVQEFLSPLSIKRNGEYGGSLENRARLLMEVLDAVRAQWPDDLPLFVRISGMERVEGGFAIEDAVQLAATLKARGDVDLIDCSSGGNDSNQ